MKSKTMQALDLVKEGMSAYAAAKQLGISQTAISRALSRREDKEICPCCGQVVREGFKVNKSILKKA
jgi:predicted transcriptional regulator